MNFRSFIRSSLSGWLFILVALILVAEIGLRLPAVAGLLPDPVPRLWHALLVQDKLDFLAKVDETQGVDLLFIGNSTTQAGINPAVFDQARRADLADADLAGHPGAFNASIEGLPPFGVEMFLPIFLKRSQPEVIIYGLSAQDLNSGSPWAMDVTERVHHSPMALAESEKGLRGWFLARLLNISQLYRYRPILLQMMITGGQQESHLEEIYFDERGHDAITDRKLSDIPQADRGYMANNAGVIHYAADGIQVDSLIAIIEETKALGIELILVNMPLAEGYYHNFDQPDDYANYLSALTAIADGHDLPLWDMEALGDEDFGDHEFADFNHLNADGAIRLSEIIAKLYTDQPTN